MKILFNWLLLIMLIAITNYIYSQQQNITINSKLYVKYSEEYLNNLLATDPEKLEYLNYYVDNCCYVDRFPDDKPIAYVELKKVKRSNNSYKILDEEITLEELSSPDFNIYNYNCSSQFDKRSYYKIGNTAKVLIVRSEKEMYRKFKTYKKLHSQE